MTKTNNERTNLLANNLTFRDISWRNFDRASNTSYNNVLWRNFCTWDWLGAGRAVYQAAGAEWESLSSDDLRWGMPGTLCPDVESIGKQLQPTVHSSEASIISGSSSRWSCSRFALPLPPFSTFRLLALTSWHLTDSRQIQEWCARHFWSKRLPSSIRRVSFWDHGRFNRFWGVSCSTAEGQLLGHGISAAEDAWGSSEEAGAMAMSWLPWDWIISDLYLLYNIYPQTPCVAQAQNSVNYKDFLFTLYISYKFSHPRLTLPFIEDLQ